MAQMGWSQMIQGRILDNQEQPVVDAYILTYHSDQHAHTDQEGRFTIHGSLGDTLLVSHISFSTKVVVVDRLDNFIIHLEESLFSLEEVVVMPQIDALNAVTRIDLETQPVRSSQEVLRRVPGLFIGQHAGGGKAEQLFLRGFDLDHGTDIAVSVDGMPVNMVSHAHGQGYADLHFLIPELIDEIDFGKGPYYAKRGDFNTAGYVDFKRKERLDRSLIQQVPQNADHAAIVVALIKMAQMLGKEVMLEGVESAAQLAFAREQGVDSVQGYRFFPALPASEIEQLLRQSAPSPGTELETF